MTEDLDALLVAVEQEAFGESWTLQRPGGAPFAASAVLDRRHVTVAFGEDAAAQTMLRTTLLVRLADMPAGFLPAQGDIARRGIEAWQVAEVQFDASGGALLILSARGGAVYP